jgi:poly(3-hydroxyalkanoate) synthetase
MQSTDIIDAVNAVLRSTRTRQRELAAFCRVTQGHVSKVLSRKAQPSAGLQADLEDWLTKAKHAEAPAGSELEEAMRRLRDAPEEHQLHILHILTNLSALV